MLMQQKSKKLGFNWNRHGQNALMLAAEKGHKNVAIALLNAGANSSALNM